MAESKRQANKNRAEEARKKSKPYPSGNDGRLHSGLRHDGYFGERVGYSKKNPPPEEPDADDG